MNLSRREFLRITTLTGAATVAAACTQPTAIPAAQTGPTTAPAAQPTAVAPAAAPTSAPAISGSSSVPTPTVPPEPMARFSEAPMLAERVAKGELPPVDERLPLNPDVPQIMDSIGKYGGTIRRAFTGTADYIGVGYALGAIGLTFTNPDLSLRAAIAESWETNEDASVWTWHLRKGTKWSDGSPFDAESFRFYWDSVLNNETLTKTKPALWSAKKDGETVLSELETPDDTTVIIRYVAPKPLLAWSVRQDVPCHHPGYSKQFHADFVEDKAALDAAVVAAGFQTWDQLYLDKQAWQNNPDRPSMRPWHPLGALSEELMVAERNPYFWQVDPEGHQLPYVDRMTHRLFSATDVFNMWILNGEIDFQQRHVDLGAYSVLKDGEETGDYDIVFGVDARSIAFGGNLACKDERLRKFFNDRRVRHAMSYAVSREEMNELAFDGMCEPRQYSPLKSSPNYYPKLSYAHLDYDPDKANALLDEAGYSQRDADGYRMYDDGSGTISFTIESYWQPGSAGEDAAMIYIRYLDAVGIKAAYKYMDRSLYTERIKANDQDACWSYWNSRTVLPTVDDNNAGHFTGMTDDPCWAGGMRLWRMSPSDPNAVEPPADHFIHKIWDIYFNEVSQIMDDAKRNKAFEKLMDVWAEELPLIGCLGEQPALTIVRRGLHNFLPGYPNESAFAAEHLQGTQTYYWDDPEKHV